MQPAPDLQALLERWRAERDLYARRGQLELAAMVASLADELEAALTARTEDVVDLTAAAAESGYSADHLTRLVREGRLRNLGRKHAPRFRRADLPRKPGHTPATGGPAEPPASLPRNVRSAVAGHITGRRA